MSVVATLTGWQTIPDATRRAGVRFIFEMSADDVLRVTREEADALRRGSRVEIRSLAGTAMERFVAEYGSYLSASVLPSFVTKPTTDDWAKLADQLAKELFGIGAGPQPRRHIVVPAKPFLVAWLNGGCAVCTDPRGALPMTCNDDCFLALDGDAKNFFGRECAAVNRGRDGALDFDEAPISNVGAYLAGACCICGVIDVDRPRGTYAHPECWNGLPLDEAVRRARECDAIKAAEAAKVAAPKVALDL